MSWLCRAYRCDDCKGYSWSGDPPNRIPDWCDHWCHIGDPDHGLWEVPP